jgi:hypothetical protein
MEWLTWVFGHLVQPDQPAKENTLLNELALHFQEPIYICTPETKVVLYWIHLDYKLFARKGLGVTSATYVISESDVDRAVLEGVTQTKERWKVEMRRDDTTGSKFRYLANVQVGEERWTDQLVLGDLIMTALAGSPPERPTSQLGLTRRRGQAELDATAPGAFNT